MSSPHTDKKLLLSLLLIALVIAGVFGAGWGVFAHTDPPPHEHPAAGNAIGEVLGSMSWVWGALLALLVMLQRLFALLVTLSGIFLNTMFKATIDLVPSLDPVVQVGWIVLRDFVNGVFILLVLWIALTIILGIEQFGGKKLLAKVLAVAILINFSLAIVTAIVVLSNQFAKAFYDKIDAGVKDDFAGYIVGVTKLQTTTASLTPEQTQQLAADAKVKAEEARLSEVVLNPFKDGMLASIGFHSASAETCAAASQRCDQEICVVKYGSTGGCNSPERRLELNACKRAAQQTGCTGGFFATERDAIGHAANGINAVVDFISVGQKQLGDWSKTTLEEVVAAIIGVVLLAIVVTTFLYAAVALGIRYFALIFLTIASPIAFLTVALPMNLGKSDGWDYWWKEFMKWIFFAPAFYFLIYLTLVMAQRMSATFSVPPGLNSIRQDPKLILGLFVVLGLLIYASRLAKKTSGKIGEFTVGLAKKAGGLAVGVTAGVATGGTLMALRGMRRGLAKPGGLVERGTNKLASSKLARIATFGASKLPQRALLGGYAADKQDVEERKKQFEHLSQDQLFAMHKGSLSAKDRTAMLSVAAGKSGWINALEKDQPGAFGRGVNTAKRYGLAQDLMKADPTVATNALLTSSDRAKVEGAGGRNTELSDPVNNPHSKAYADNAVRQVSENLTGKQIDDMNTDALDNDEVLDGLIRNNNLTTTRLRDVVHKNFEKGQKLLAAMPEALEQIGRDIASLDAAARAATATGNTTKAAELNAQKSTLSAQANRLNDIRRYITTTPGGTGLGVTPAGWTAPTTPINYTGNRVINTQAGRSVAVDIARSVAGGTGAHTFATTPGSGFIVGADGILKTDPTMSLLPGIHPVTVTVTDAAGATTNINLTVNINP